MTRTFSPYAGKKARTSLETLANKSVRPAKYRDAMTELGRLLGSRIVAALGRTEPVVLACGVEDADFLARGALKSLENGARRVRLACFWNDRFSLEQEEFAPIVRRYVEPFEGDRATAVVIIKSIISTACAVRTNLLDLLDDVQPTTIYVAAPVLYKDARASLEREFPRKIVRRFSYVYFAIDSERRGNIVIPGIGGSVYERLGIGDVATKNKYRPELIRARRQLADLGGPNHGQRTPTLAE